MSCPVKLYRSTQPGAPVINGTAGSRKAVLDACLINGWGVTAVTSLTVSGGVATATVAAGHPFEADGPALISGASVAALNGEQRITAAAAGSFSFAAPGVPDGSVSGSISAKVAPAGWLKPYESGNKAVYASAAPDATACRFRLDDTAARYALIRGYETMSDLDSGVGLFPTAAQQSAGLYIAGSNAATADARNWMLIADTHFCILLIAHNSSAPLDYNATAFGDFETWRNPDAFNAIVMAGEADASGANNAGGDSPSVRAVGTDSGTYLARKYTQLGGSVKTARSIGPFNAASLPTSGSNGFAAGPSPVDNVLSVMPVYLMGEPTAPHGVFPGLYFVPAYLGSTYDSGSKLVAPVGLPGRTLLAFRVGGYADPAQSGRMFVDVTGPWR